MNSARDIHCWMGCPIRRSRDQRALASTPGFSQRATSFIASRCQGIHQMPLPQRLIAKTRRLQRQALPTNRPSREDTYSEEAISYKPVSFKPPASSAFTERTVTHCTLALALRLTAYGSELTAPSAHSLFTCQRSNAHELAPMGKPAFPDQSASIACRAST
jgi:hypothetical protein